jgi:hypothetical protein
MKGEVTVVCQCRRTWPDFFPTGTTRMFGEHAELEVMMDLLPMSIPVDHETWKEKERSRQNPRSQEQVVVWRKAEEHNPTPPRRSKITQTLCRKSLVCSTNRPGHGANNEHRYHHYKG